MKARRRIQLAVTLSIVTMTAWLAPAYGEVRCGDRPCDDDFVLRVGHQTYISSDHPVKRIAVGDPDIAQVSSVFDTGALLVATKVGRTNALIWEGSDPKPTQIDIVVAADAQGLIDELRSDSRFFQVALETGSERPALSGRVSDLETYAALRELVTSYLGSDYIDQIIVLQNTMVSVEVRFAILSTSTLKRLGFDFTLMANNFQAAVANPSGVGSYSFDPTEGLSLTKSLPISDAFNLFFSLPGANFMSVLSALDGIQVATTLAEPTLVVRSGETAEFVAGGEVPIPVPRGNDSVGIEFREFGIGLELEPTVLSRDRIVLKIRPEISDLDFANSVSISGTSVPALTRRSASTTLELESGQSFILAGLLSETANNAEEQVPYFGDIPILGMFFKRVRNSRERQELIIVATPRLVSPLDGDPKALPLPGSEMQRYDPSILEMLASENRLADALPPHGLMP